MRMIGVRLAGLLGLAAMVPAQGHAQVQFYNGDPDGVASRASWDSGLSGITSMLFENFTVGPGGLTVTGLFGQFTYGFGAEPSPSTALWEIRSGVTNGNGGTLIGGGSSASSWTDTGIPSGVFDTSIFTAAITGLSVFLAPGEYWFGLSPSHSEQSGGSIFMLSTGGVNGINATLDQLSHYHLPAFGVNYSQLDEYDWALGVTGIVGEPSSTVPEPATMTLLATGLVGLAAGRRRRGKA